jgi:cell division protein FtsI (penicillin-binding protein 3)
LSSVLALFPTEDPRLIVYVVLENPQGESIYGAQTAAPMVKKIAETLSPVYGIPLAGTSSWTIPEK